MIATGKALQNLAAIAALVKLAKNAQADGKTTDEELAQILIDGVLPILELNGVKLNFGDSTGTTAEQVRSAISLMSLFDATPSLPDRG